MKKLVETREGDTRGGAALILANTLAVTYEEAKQLLRYAGDEAEVPNCWLEFIEGTVKDADDSEAIAFLEELLSAASTYSKVVKYAALSKYEQVARSSTIDIVQQEVG